MFELGGQLAVDGADSPVVEWIDNPLISSNVDHWFDGEANARFKGNAVKAWVGIVRYRRILMKFGTQSVADVFAIDAESVFLGFRNNGVPDLGNFTSRANRINGLVKTIKGTLRDTSCVITHFANQKSLRLIAVPTVDNRGNVDIHDVSIL